MSRARTTLAAAAVAILVNISPSAACAMEQVPVLGTITRAITLRTYQSQQENASVYVEVPRVEGGSGALNAAVEQYTSAIPAEYEKNAAAVLEYDQTPSASPAQTNRYELDLRYTVVTDSGAIFALRFDKAVVMNSGVKSVKIYSMDKAAGALLTLDNLFLPDSSYLDILTQIIQQQMRQRMEADESLTCWVDSEFPGLDVTQLEARADCYLNGDGQLVIVFDVGEVAPMYMGIVEFAIAQETLRISCSQSISNDRRTGGSRIYSLRFLSPKVTIWLQKGNRRIKLCTRTG